MAIKKNQIIEEDFEEHSLYNKYKDLISREMSKVKKENHNNKKIKTLNKNSKKILN